MCRKAKLKSGSLARVSRKAKSLSTENLTENTASVNDASTDAGEQQTIARRKRRRRLKGADYKHKKHGASAEPVGEILASSDVDDGADGDDSTDASASTGEQAEQQDGRTGRRRKRNRRKKNKHGQQPQQAQAQPQAQSQPQQQQPRNDTPQPKFNEQARFFGRRQQGGGGGGFSQSNGNGGGRRGDRRQRRGPNGFVGPMDHTYRGDDTFGQSTVGVNGNFGKQQRSTNMNVNGNIASYADSVTVPVRDNAVTRVYCFIEDLFFHAKIRETSKMVGVKVEFLKNDKEQIERMLQTATTIPVLVVVDLNNLAAKPLPLIKKLRPKLTKGSSLIGFVQHVQGELKMEAQEAGCDVVMPRSAFSSNLPNILRRFTDDEGEEPNFNTEGAYTN